jgi:hypothetical protein
MVAYPQSRGVKLQLASRVGLAVRFIIVSDFWKTAGRVTLNMAFEVVIELNTTSGVNLLRVFHS